MKKFGIFLGLLTLLFSLAHSMTYEDEAWKNLQSLAGEVEQWVYSEYGYQLEYREDMVDLAYLNTGATITLSGTFYSGNTYVAACTGDSRVADTDIYVYDQYGNSIMSDTSDEKDGLVTFTIYSTATYYIQVKLYQSYDTGAYVGYYTSYMY